MRTLLFITLLAFGFQEVQSQSGQLSGKVTDAKTGEELVGATILIDGTTNGTITDFNGEYKLQNIAEGTYTFKCQFISYEPSIISNISIKTGQTIQLDFKLKTVELDLQEVKVVAKANRSGEAMLLIEQKNAILASQAIGAQELSRKGVGDAEGAVTKVSGISKQEGVKNVFVRGLGDRYNSTSLNGYPVPSEDPEYKNISLDVFTSDMIQAVGVNKVFGANITGDVIGADINIASKELVGDKELAFDAKAGVNTLNLGADFLKTDGVNNFGFAPTNEGPKSESVYNFKNALTPTIINAPINKGFSFSGGHKSYLGANNNPLSFCVIGSYDNSFEYRHGQVRNTTTTGTIFRDMAFEKYKQNASHLLLGNLNYRVKNALISYNGLYIHNSTQFVSDQTGRNATFADVEQEEGFTRRHQTNDNDLLVNQLHINSPVTKRLTFDGGISLNLIVGDEPDRRINYLSNHGNNIYRLTKGTGRQQRYFSQMNETDLNFRSSLKYKLSNSDDNKTAFTVGYTGRLINRTFNAVEYDQSVKQQPDMFLSSLNLDEFFNQTNLSNGAFILDRNNDEYSVNKFVMAAFTELVWQLSTKTTAVIGLKVDNAYIKVDYLVNRGATNGATLLDELFVLPSLNIKHELNISNTLRLGISRSYVLPQAKEISPFRYTGEDFLSQGNPNLKPALSNNADIKWDFYLSGDEIISVGAFYKFIENPISRVEKASAGGYLSYDNISKSTSVEGIEMELRKNIWKRNDNKLSFGFNASYTLSNIKLASNNFTNSSSQLEGASPFIANADISLQIGKNAFSSTHSLVYNTFSDRIYTIGTQGYQDIIEKGVGTLDYVGSLKIHKRFGLSLKAKNLTDPVYQLNRQPNMSNESPIVLNSYRKGVSLSMGLTYKL